MELSVSCYFNGGESSSSRGCSIQGSTPEFALVDSTILQSSVYGLGAAADKWCKLLANGGAQGGRDYHRGLRCVCLCVSICGVWYCSSIELKVGGEGLRVIASMASVPGGCKACPKANAWAFGVSFPLEAWAPDLYCVQKQKGQHCLLCAYIASCRKIRCSRGVCVQFGVPCCVSVCFVCAGRV